MTKSLEHEVKPPDSLYWANVLRERDVLKGQLDAMEESLAEKDVRIAELETDLRWERSTWPRVIAEAIGCLPDKTGRTPSMLASAVSARIAELERGGDWPEARRLREAWAKASDEDRFFVCDDWMLADDGGTTRRDLGKALRAFCESAPPASAPSDDEIVSALAERTRQVAQLQSERDQLRVNSDRAARVTDYLSSNAHRLPCVNPGEPLDGAVRSVVEALVTECDDRASTIGALNCRLYDAWKERDSALAQARSWREAMDKMVKDHEAEGALWSKEMGAKDAELRALKSDEYTRAAVAWAEECASGRSLAAISITAEAFLALYNARHRFCASAPDVEKAAPAPADEKRVTVYVALHSDGSCSSIRGEPYAHMMPPGAKWLAIDARVVREGGGK